MKVAVAGYGSIGKRYVQWLSELNSEVGVYDKDPNRLSDIAPAVATAFKSFDELLSWGPSKVLVSTPPLYHVAPAIRALESGADVLIEKPIATTVEDADRVIEKAEKLNKTISVVCNMRFHPAVRTISGVFTKIGRPLCARGHFAHRLSQMRPAGVEVYAASNAEGGGVILDCIHEFDYMQCLLGPVKRVRGWSARIGDDQIQADDVADIQLEFRNGCHGVIHFDFLSRLKRRGLEIIGSDATVVWQSSGRNPESCEVVLGDQHRSRVLYHDEAVDPHYSYKEMLKRFMNDEKGLQTGMEARNTLRAALAASSPEWQEL